MARCINADSINQECSKNFNNTNINRLQHNIDHTLLDLLNQTTLNGYAKTSYGEGMDTIYGLTRCRGDISQEICSSCILDATNKVRTICPFSAEAKIWFEYCFLRYDSNNFFGQIDSSYIQGWGSYFNATDPVAFDQIVSKLLDVVIVDASTRESRFARGESYVPNSNLNIYAMAQCTRDLEEKGCKQCLEILLGSMLNCKYRLGCYKISASCVLRREINVFLNGADAPSPVAHAPISA